MQRFVFKSVDQYREWRAHWRKEYNETARRLHINKRMRKKANSVEMIKRMQKNIAHDQQTARSLLIARQAVEFAYLLNKKVTYSVEA